jgi:cytoskeletal protein CcmA (bactofilin family)
MAKLLTGTRIYGTATVDTQLFVNGTNTSVSTTTGALQVIGGVGVGGNLNVGGSITATNIYVKGFAVSTSTFNGTIAFGPSNQLTDIAKVALAQSFIS